jgi:4'-phosphopantetheinyl transferase
MSHSDELALIAIARGLPPGAEIGVDIEALREVRNTAELAAANFTARERAELAQVAPRERNWYFLSGWTRKEACLKAVGSGLSIAPSTFECALAPVRTLTRIPTPQGHRTVEVESIDVQDGHLAAIAITIPAADR